MLIGITGAKGSGKDTLADAFIQKNFRSTKFAGALKDMLRTLYRCAGVNEVTIERKLEGDLKEEPCDVLCGKTPRWAMQSLGTEWRNMIHTQLWSQIWESGVEALLLEGAPVVCSDVRFHHEAAAIRDMGGYLIRVDRPGCGEGDQHASEVEMGDIQVDVTFSNIGTISQLHTKAEEYLKEITT